jgi:hypothetical protein
MATGTISNGLPVNSTASTSDSSVISKIAKDSATSTDNSTPLFSPTVKTDVSKNQVFGDSTGQGSKAAVSPSVVTVAPTLDSAAPAENKSTISLETANGTSSPVVTTTKQTVGAANASDDAATNASAKKALDTVDAELASKLGSKYTAPATQQDRVKLVAQVANSLSGAEKTAFLNKIGAAGKDFGLNFGQPSISTSGANLSTAQKQIQAALYTEWQTGKPFSKDVASTTPTTADTKKSTPDTAASGKPNTEGTALSNPELRQGAKNIIAMVKARGENTAAVRAYFAGFDANGDGKLSEMEMIAAGGGGQDGVDAVTWSTTNQRSLMPEKGVSVSLDRVTANAIEQSKKY